MSQLTPADWRSPAGQLLRQLYADCKGLEAGTADWPGADVVDIVTNTFDTAGVDLDRGVEQFAAYDVPAPADESFQPTRQGYRLSRVHKIAGHTIRVTVDRDEYAPQSRAVAEVLTPALTWTVLADEEPAAWRKVTTSHHDLGYKKQPHVVPLSVDALANKLLARALGILGY